MKKVKRLTLGRASAGLRHGWMRGGCGWGVDADGAWMRTDGDRRVVVMGNERDV